LSIIKNMAEEERQDFFYKLFENEEYYCFKCEKIKKGLDRATQIMRDGKLIQCICDNCLTIYDLILTRNNDGIGIISKVKGITLI